MAAGLEGVQEHIVGLIQGPRKGLEMCCGFMCLLWKFYRLILTIFISTSWNVIQRILLTKIKMSDSNDNFLINKVWHELHREGATVH